MASFPLDRLGQVAQVFLKLGTIGFGGPAAHIAMMEEEVVTRRGWLTREAFLDLVGATNLIPGPNSTEMAIHVGYIYAGWPGLMVAGLCFILPAVLITGGFAWFYVTFGQLPQVVPLLAGIKPAVLAIIGGAVWKLGKSALKYPQLGLIAIAVMIALFAGLNEVLALLLGGFLGMLGLRPIPPPSSLKSWFLPFPMLLSQVAITPPPPLWQLGLVFLKVGSVLFGSGYVLVAFLEGELVEKYGWLTQQQLLDAIAIGQFTPGPVSSSATFIGYQIAGWAGAIVATLGIFLPSFLFVVLLNPLIPQLRSSRWTAAFLDAINISAVALMAVVTFNLGWVIFIKTTGPWQIQWPAIFIFAVALFSVIRWRINAAWLVLGGAILGGIFAGLKLGL